MSESLSGIIEHITFHNPENGMVLRTDDAPTPTCATILHVVVVG